MTRRLFTYAMPALLSAAVLLSTTITSCAAAPSGFSDTGRHWSADSVRWAVEQRIVDGYEDGTFRPDQQVSEPEFLAMLLRAYPSSSSLESPAGAAWYEAYYTYTRTQNWPTLGSEDRTRYNRGHVARLVASTQTAPMNLNDSIRYLLDQGLSEGRSSATVAGYEAEAPLSRAEAVQFIRNLKSRTSVLRAAPAPAPGEEPAAPSSQASVTAAGIAIGDTEQSVLQKLGTPARKDPGEYGFHWYIYNKDYAKYVQIGISNGRVTALYSPSDVYETSQGISDGSTAAEVKRQYGEPLAYILKGHTRFMLNYGEGEYGTYEIDGSYVTFFYDLHRDGVVTGIQAVERSTEQALAAFYPDGSEALATAFERQSFDLANAARVKLGLQPFAWDDTAASAARKHSRNMAELGFFDHNNPGGQSPFDRMKQEGISYRTAAENIAAGQTSAIFAHHGWMNSEGHRKNLLSSIRKLGVGVYFGGKMSIYYTQNFYTP